MMQMSTLHVLLSEVVSASFAVSQQSVVPIVGCIEMLVILLRRLKWCALTGLAWSTGVQGAPIAAKKI